MRWNLVIWVVLLLAAVVVIAGCTTTSGIMTTVSVGTTAQPCSRATIQASVLQGYMPAAPFGWTNGTTYNYDHDTGQGCEIVWVWHDYGKGSLHMIMTIWDTNYNFTSGVSDMLSTSPWASGGTYGKLVTVQGYPGYEDAFTDGNYIRVTVSVGNGIFVQGFLEGSTSTSEIYTFMNAVNYAGLDGLA